MYAREPIEERIFWWVHEIVVSRQKHGSPLKAVTLFFHDAKKLLQKFRRWMGDLNGRVEPVRIHVLSVQWVALGWMGDGVQGCIEAGH